MIHCRGRRTTRRDWIQAPIVHPTAPTVRVDPATRSETWRCSTSISGTNASAPKNAPAMSVRTRITGARPGRNRKNPRGIRLGRLQPSRARPTVPSSRPEASRRRPASCTTVAPRAANAAAQSAAGFTCGVDVAATGASASRNSFGSMAAAPIATSGSTAQKTARQPRWWVSHAATDGPTNDGTTQAVEM